MFSLFWKCSEKQEFKYSIREEELVHLYSEVKTRHYKNLLSLYEVAQENRGYDVLYYGFIHECRFVYTHFTHSDKVDEIALKLLDGSMNESLVWLIDHSGLLDEEYGESLAVIYKDGAWRIYNIHGQNLMEAVK